MSPRLKTQLAEPPTSLALPASKTVRPPLWRVGVLVAAALGGHAVFTGSTPPGPEPELALAQALATQHGLSASPSDVFWADPPPAWWNPWHSRRAWALAALPSGLDDVYLVEAQATPEGHGAGTKAVYNL